MFENYLFDNAERLKGTIGIYYKNLSTGVTLSHNENKSIISASVIKVPILVEAFHQIESGKITKNDTIILCDDDKMPSCGALSYMHSGLEVTIEDLCTLMIILSDNTATNLLIKRLGFDSINGYMQELGLKNTFLARLLFDMEADKKGARNVISAKDVGMLLELMWQGKLISPAASKQMLDILKLQQLNHKLPAKLDEEVEVAHKTGEDTGITHDAGIIYAESPFILCVLSEKTDVVETNSFISELAYQAYISERVRHC
ncbi:MAG TPA: serine hydrolase [Clostridia bacterium]|nr:serine hydrolase [Clostridia bacterium]